MIYQLITRNTIDGILKYCGKCKRWITDYYDIANKADGSVICPYCKKENVE